MGKKNKEPVIQQPTAEQQRWYQSVRDNDRSVVSVRGHKYEIGWLYPAQIAKLGRLLLRKSRVDVAGEDGKTQTSVIDENALAQFLYDQKLACKAAAIFLLDGYWKLRMWYGVVWRWFYYVRQYNHFDLDQLIGEGKKKVPLEQFLKITMYLTGVRDTLMMMRTEEAERILRELSSAASTPSAKESAASPAAGTSSSA